MKDIQLRANNLPELSNGIPDQIINEHGCKGCELSGTDECPNTPPICQARKDWLCQFITDDKKLPSVNDWDLILKRYKGNDILQGLERVWRSFEKRMMERLEQTDADDYTYKSLRKSYDVNYKRWFELFREMLKAADNAVARETVKRVQNTNVAIQAKPSDVNRLIRGEDND